MNERATGLAVRAERAERARGNTVFRSGAPRGGREVQAYEAACARLGLEPSANLLVPVRRNGVLAFRATAQAADALASRFSLRREVQGGPRVLVCEGKRPLACAVCVATRPDGHSATATTTAVLDPEGNALMACETRARRLATLRVLGLEALVGEVREGIPAGYMPGEVRVLSDTRGPGMRGVRAGAKGEPLRGEEMGEEKMRSELMRSEAMRSFAMERVGASFESAKGPAGKKVTETLWDPRTANDNALTGDGARPEGAMAGFLAGCAALQGREGAAALWIARRGSIAGLSAQERTEAWGAVVARVRAFSAGSTSAAAAADWLKRAVRAAEG